MLWSRSKAEIPAPEDALAGRDEPPFEISGEHAVNGHSIVPPFPDGMEVAVFALGCFWGAERLYWSVPGVWATAVGYAGGTTRNPTYEETCSGRTGHTESVLVAFDPDLVSYRELLQVFFDEHDPTQGMRQGNDVGTQYRSAIYWTTDEQEHEARAAAEAYAKALAEAGKGQVTTELAPAGEFFYAEEYHQQYLHKVPNGYCGLRGTGVTCALPGPSSAAVESSPTPSGPADHGTPDDPKLKPVADSDDEWRSRLSPEQFDVLRQAGTERAFTGAYNDAEDPGLYRCMACGNPLFRSDDKFHSGSGWPSFTEAISPDAVELLTDRKFGMSRTEVRCGRCHSHLGHVFDDGPRDRGGKRYCMNSASLDLDQEG
jgi:peptide-methionine (S)-S-oxide reductase